MALAPWIVSACLALCAAAPSERVENPSQRAESTEEHVETWPDGSVRLRYQTDAEGRRSGRSEEFARDGTLIVRANYRADELDGREQRWFPDGARERVATWKAGVLQGRFERFHPQGGRAVLAAYARGELDGKYEQRSADGERVLNARYADGRLDGWLEVKQSGKRLTRQVWSEGELRTIDGFEPFPRRREELLSALRAIQAPPPGAAGPGDPRAAALRRLQAYRHLCRLPWEGMSLVEEWNEKCAAAAEVCRRLGRITHTPERPEGVDDALYAKGREGASRSNLSMGTDLVGSVDSYMDDSDPSNIDRVGHRRWCLNPKMRRTGFGSAERFSAMWSMDSSGGGSSGLDFVAYPPTGYVPVDLFGPRHAWSLASTKGRVPDEDDVVVRIVPLGEHFLPEGEPLELDYLGVSGAAYGGMPCVIFRPVGLEVQPGRAYRCSVSFDGGKSQDYEALVVFTDPST